MNENEPKNERYRERESNSELKFEDEEGEGEDKRNSEDGGGSDANHEDNLASQHTSNFPELLRQLGISVAVTTYQAGKLVFLRDGGDSINTHFRGMPRPMGLALAPGCLAVGTHHEIMEFRDMPAVAPRLDPPDVNDAVYLPRRIHITGAIDIHEMAFDKENALWFVNTAFSCLCTLDQASSFVPRWRPRWVSHYSEHDRCHLNGLGMRDGAPAVLSALGQTDTVRGWRANKRDGGVLIDYASQEVIAQGLSMPHSPRWHQNKLWALESGRGALVTVDPQSGKTTDVARIPGFVRGLDFYGPLAFVGLSQLRDTTPFTDIEITESNTDRQSGVWVVHIETGQTLAFLKFTGGVQEIFAVAVLPHSRQPEMVIEPGKILNLSYALPDDALALAKPASEPAPPPEATPGLETLDKQ